MRHETCKTHQNYALTCGQHESLLARSGNVCEICGCPAGETVRGKLAIDHHAAVGQWAVRGLLCRECNTNMRRLPAGDPRLGRYFDQSWYLGELDRVGLVIGYYPEPALRSVVGEPTGKHWRRLKRGWLRFDPYRRIVAIPESWERLIYQYGPINLHQHKRVGVSASALFAAA